MLFHVQQVYRFTASGVVRIFCLFRMYKEQGIHCTGITEKTGRMAQKNPCQGKHREFGNFAKTQGIWFAQVVNSLIPKVKI